MLIRKNTILVDLNFIKIPLKLGTKFKLIF